MRARLSLDDADALSGGAKAEADPFGGPQAFSGPSAAESVQINPATEVPASTATTYTLAVGDSAVSQIDTAGDGDWYRVQLVAGQSYVFTLTGTGGAPLTDPYLELRNSSGTLISLDDDGGVWPNSLLRFTATTTGTYYINARAWAPDEGPLYTGGYTLTFDNGPAQNPLDTINLGLTVPTHTISVYFATTGQTFGDETAMRSWTAAEITDAFNALATYEAIADLHFVQTNNSASANFILTLADLPANTLGQFGTTGGVGYGTFDPTATGWTTAGLQPGGIGFVTLIHEFGHGLGLAHPHDSAGDSETMQGVIDEFDSYGTYLLNQGVFTTMSYNDGWPAGPMGFNFSTTYGSQATPGALDVALIQQKYGINPDTNSGNTVYTLGDANAAGAAYRTIWDVGGVDTIVYNGAGDARIDLHDATLLGEIGGGGFVSYVRQYQGGFTIAAGVVIENAQGGSGWDLLVGNEAANQLIGGDGRDTITGGEGSDVLFGGADSDSIDGGQGADTMYGGAGSDAFFVDNTADVVADGDVNDNIYSTVTFVLPDTVQFLELDGAAAIDGTGNAGLNIIFGNEAANHLFGLAGEDTLRGASGDDLLQGGDDNDSLDGGAGADIMLGGSGQDNLSGGDDDDALDGGEGADTMLGGAGNDVYTVDSSSDLVGESSAQGADTVVASVDFTLAHDVEFLYLSGVTGLSGTGNELNNGLLGNEAANTLSGLGGADTLDGGAGADSMLGGLGDDVFYIESAGDVVTENVGEGTDTIRSSIGVGALAANVENLELLGAALNATGNVLGNSITGNANNNILNGAAGADTLIGGAGDDTYTVDSSGDVVTEGAGAGTDVIFSTIDINALAANVENLTLSGLALTATGNALANVLTGDAQNNTLNGGAGEDSMAGGFGNDTYVVNSAGDVVTENANSGFDTVIAFLDLATLGANIEYLTLAGSALLGGGNELNNVIVGNGFANTLSGGLGGDQLNGAGGADTMSGGLGDDSYLVENAGDVVAEASGEGYDTVYAFVSILALAANVEKLTLMPAGGAIDGTANGLDNRLNGNDSNNVLAGLGGADVINGLGGNDRIIGGAGLDNIFGGAGSDTFVYGALSDSGLTGAARDLINDFTQGADLIDLSAIDADGFNSGDQAFTLIGASAFSHTAGELRYDLLDASGTANDFTLVSMDTNGDGAADSQITLRGLITFTSADFIL